MTKTTAKSVPSTCTASVDRAEADAVVAGGDPQEGDLAEVERDHAVLGVEVVPAALLELLAQVLEVVFGEAGLRSPGRLRSRSRRAVHLPSVPSCWFDDLGEDPAGRAGVKEGDAALADADPRLGVDQVDAGGGEARQGRRRCRRPRRRRGGGRGRSWRGICRRRCRGRAGAAARRGPRRRPAAPPRRPATRPSPGARAPSRSSRRRGRARRRDPRLPPRCGRSVRTCGGVYAARAGATRRGGSRPSPRG